MRYSVIGASGTLGQVAVRQLLARPATTAINALIRRPDEGLGGLDGCTTLVGGIFDDAQLDRCVAESDIVVNLAALNPSGDDLDRENYRDFFLLNGAGAATVAAAAAHHGKPLLHFSSVAVYEAGAGDGNGLFGEGDPLPSGDPEILDWWNGLFARLLSHFTGNEAATHSDAAADLLNTYFDDKPLPATAPVYGLSKLLGESLALRIAESAIAIRMSDVYGPGHESRGVVTDHLKMLAADNAVTVDFGFRSSACFVYIDDVADFIASIAERCVKSGELPRIVNFVGEHADEEKFGGLLRELVGDAKITVRDADARSTSIERRYTRKSFDLHFRNVNATPFADGLRKTLAGYFA